VPTSLAKTFRSVSQSARNVPGDVSVSMSGSHHIPDTPNPFARPNL
jgi:hypothetical protein